MPSLKEGKRTMMRKIAVVTSGDDAPGINAAVRAVTRTAIEHGWEVAGVRGGYSGLIKGDFIPLSARSVGGIIQLGGTILGSEKSPAFLTSAGREIALNRLASFDIDALIVIGGDGSQAGAYVLSQMGFPVVGIAATIDNDLVGSEPAIGVDSALNVALEAIDQLRTISLSRDTAFVVEVAGRKCGYVALMAGIAGGAEAIVVPEIPISAEQIIESVRMAYACGKSHAIVVVAKGAIDHLKNLAEHFTHDHRLRMVLQKTSLCHVQRGGAPSGFDRLLATHLGSRAVDALARGETGVMAGYIDGQTTTTGLAEVVSKPRVIDMELVRMSRVLSV
jgi:6-phosphofructokinase 1